jgi:hypothetical protein
LAAVKGRLGHRLRRRVSKTTPENRPAHRVGLYTELLEDRTLLSGISFDWFSHSGDAVSLPLSEFIAGTNYTITDVTIINADDFDEAFTLDFDSLIDAT